MDAAAMLEEEAARRRRIPLPVAVATAARAGRRAWEDDPETRATARTREGWWGVNIALPDAPAEAARR